MFLCTRAQIIITGKILDSITSQPIAYASLGIAGSNKGTITNEQGVFVIKVDSLPVKLSIFYIGYAPKIVRITKKDEIVIRLRQLTVNLKEVIVKAGEGEFIFKKAYQKLIDQKEFVYQSKSFFRLLTKNDDTCTEMIENFYDTWLGKSGIKHWELEHGRYALAKDYREKGYAISLELSLLTRYIDILNNFQTGDIRYLLFVFDKKYFDHLLFSITSRFVSNGDEIVKIDFYPVKKEKKKIFCSGSVYINTKTYDVYRLVQQWSAWQDPLVFTHDKTKNIKNFKAAFDISFAPNKDHQMLINHIRMRIDYDMVERNTEKLVHKVNMYSDLLFYDYDEKQGNINQIPADDDYRTDYENISQRLYIKRFWDNNPVLAETPIEKGIREGFEKSGSFGKIFNNANDTLEILKDNYKIWNKKKPLHLADIHNSISDHSVLNKCEITEDGDTLGGLYSELYFAWNCYNDTFYYIVLPLLDTRETWITDSFRLSPYAEFLYQKYFDLLEIHKRKFKTILQTLDRPCLNRKMIMQLYDQANADFRDESLKMLRECWVGTDKEYYIWENRIDEMLEKYKEE